MHAAGAAMRGHYGAGGMQPEAPQARPELAWDSDTVPMLKLCAVPSLPEASAASCSKAQLRGSGRACRLRPGGGLAAAGLGAVGASAGDSGEADLPVVSTTCCRCLSCTASKPSSPMQEDAYELIPGSACPCCLAQHAGACAGPPRRPSTTEECTQLARRVAQTVPSQAQ